MALGAEVAGGVVVDTHMHAGIGHIAQPPQHIVGEVVVLVDQVGAVDTGFLRRLLAHAITGPVIRIRSRLHLKSLGVSRNRIIEIADDPGDLPHGVVAGWLEEKNNSNRNKTGRPKLVSGVQATSGTVEKAGTAMPELTVGAAAEWRVESAPYK